MSPVLSAQQVFDEMLKSGIRPRLKALGFTGSGATFVWPSATCFAHLGFQKSQFSDRSRLKFTVNVTVAEQAAWEAARRSRPYLPTKPAANTLYGDYVSWQCRIGPLLPGGEDLWWSLRADQAWTDVADAVVSAVAEHVVPELEIRARP